jgi:hypothetical protein
MAQIISYSFHPQDTQIRGPGPRPLTGGASNRTLNCRLPLTAISLRRRMSIPSHLRKTLQTPLPSHRRSSGFFSKGNPKRTKTTIAYEASYHCNI